MQQSLPISSPLRKALVARFYLDNDVALPVADELRSFGHDVVTTRDLHRGHTRDDEQMLFATRESRILVTHDHGFIDLHHTWLSWSAEWSVHPEHAGILIPPQQIWLAPQLAVEIHTFIQSTPPRPNRVYQWHPSKGWITL